MTPRPRSIPPLFRSSSSSRRSIQHVRAMVLASMNEGAQLSDNDNIHNTSGRIAGAVSTNDNVSSARPRGRSRLRRSYHSSSTTTTTSQNNSSHSRTSNRRTFLRRSLSIASSSAVTACTAPTVASSTTYTSMSPPPPPIPSLTTTTTTSIDNDHRAVVVTVTSDDNSHDSIEISSSGSSRGEYDIDDHDIDDHDDGDDDDDDEPAAAVTKFHSAAYGLEEYNNAIVASRDTNVSPREVYDTIASDYLIEAAAAASTAAIAAAASQQQQQQQQYNRKQQQQQQQQQNTQSIVLSSPRALDVGAGAGVSTEVLYNMGYHTIDAIDWSSTAWTKYVIEDKTGTCPESVHFYAMDDERYLDQHISSTSNNNNHDENNMFDVIVFNFAINKSKALRFATSILNKDHGRLLAPINTNDDYWMKQTYTVLDARGAILWSTTDVGAWSVLFQPDVTQDTCSGVWCSQYNGFQKKQK